MFRKCDNIMFAVLSSDITSFPFSFLTENREKRMVSVGCVNLIENWVVFSFDRKGMITI